MWPCYMSEFPLVSALRVCVLLYESFFCLWSFCLFVVGCSSLTFIVWEVVINLISIRKIVQKTLFLNL